MVEVVNIVASGNFGREFDLGPLAADLDAFWTQYEPETFPGMQIRFESNGPVIILYSTGTYTIMGADSKYQLTDINQRVVAAFADLGISVKEQRPEIKNLICKGELGRELDLEAFVIELGMENIEYEPEQSPFVYYWPEDLDCLITIPTNGELIVTGVNEVAKAEEAIDHLQMKVESLIRGENNLD